MMGVWPLTGRAEELRHVDAVLSLPDGPQGIVVAGVAGVGKTRLAQEALAGAERRGATVRWAIGTQSARSLPLGAFAGMLGPVRDDGSEALRQATTALLDGAGPAGVVVGVDDAHLLDDLSAVLIHQLVLRRSARVVLTVRSGESVPDAVTALWKDGQLSRLEVQPLSDAELTRLLEAALDGQLDRGSRSRLCSLARGSALYLRELIGGGLEAGRLRQEGGVWRWVGDAAVTPSLFQLIDGRMGRLSEPLRELLDTLALSEPLPVTVLNRLTGARTVERAEARGLISVQADGSRLQARLGHPLYGEVQRLRLGPVRAARLRGRIVRHVEHEQAAYASSASDAGTLRLAVLRLESNLPGRPGLYLEAAEQSLELCDLLLAERLARAAVTSDEDDFAARSVLAYTLSLMGRGAEAESHLAGLTAGARTEEHRAQAGLTRAGNLFWTLARPDDAERELAAAAAAVTGPVPRAVLAAGQAAVHAGRARPAAAVHAATIALAEPALPELAVMLATWGLAAGLGDIGRGQEIDAVVSRGYRVADRSAALRIHRFGLGALHMTALRLAGHIGDVQRVAQDRAAESLGLIGGWQPMASVLLGQAALAGGQLRTAQRHLREALAVLPSVGAPGWAFLGLLGLTQALGMSGDVAAAHAALSDLEATRHPAFASLDPELILARAWVLAARGAITEAVRACTEAAALAASSGQPARELTALHTAVRFGDRSLAHRLTDLAQRVYGPLPAAAANQAVALAADDGGALAEVSRRFEQMGDLLAAADAAAQAAAAYRHSGLTGSAHVAAARAQRLAALCEGARTPAVLLAARPLPLTPREREIVRLAAGGLTSRQIAAELVISVRTVEGHIYRASEKLGTTDRATFAALLGELPDGGAPAAPPLAASAPATAPATAPVTDSVTGTSAGMTLTAAAWPVTEPPADERAERQPAPA